MEITLLPMKNNSFKLYFFAFILFSISCGKVKNFEFKKIESWNINEMGLSSNVFSTRVLFYNPNSFAIKLKHLEGNITIEGEDIGLCLSDTLIRIAAKQEFSLPIAIQLKTGALLLKGLTFLAKDSIRIKFNGFARVGRSGFFVNYKFDNESEVRTMF